MKPKAHRRRLEARIEFHKKHPESPKGGHAHKRPGSLKK